MADKGDEQKENVGTDEEQIDDTVPGIIYLLM